MDSDCHGPEPTGCFFIVLGAAGYNANDGQALSEEEKLAVVVCCDSLVILLLYRNSGESRL